MKPFPWVGRARLRFAEEEAVRWHTKAQREHERANRAELQAGELLAAYRKLVDQVVSLKRRGFEVAPEPKKPRAILPEPEEVGLRRAEERVLKAAEGEFVERAAKDLMQQGFDSVAAEREARRLLAEATDAHPAGG